MDKSNVLLLKYLSLKKVASHLDIQLKICSHHNFIIPQSISNLIFSFAKEKYSFLNEYETEFFSSNHTRLTMCDINSRDMTRFENFEFLRNQNIQYIRIIGKYEFNRTIKEIYPFEIKNLRLENFNFEGNKGVYTTILSDWQYFFNSLRSLKILYICDSSFNYNESSIFFEYLCSNCNKLESLTIKYCSFDYEIDGKFLNFLSKRETLKYVNLLGNFYKRDKNLKKSKFEFRKNSNLNNLKIDLSVFGSKNRSLCLKSIKKMENLMNLTINFLPINKSQELNAFFTVLMGNLNLRKINLKFRFSKETYKFIDFILSMENLESLHINFQSFKDQEYFFKGISKVNYLKKLTVNLGLMDDDQFIINTIMNQKNLKKLKLLNKHEKSQYDFCLINRLLKSIPYLPTLSKLNISHFTNGVGDCFEHLGNFIQKQKSIDNLVFDSVKIDNYMHAKVFFSILNRSTIDITKLILKKCSFATKGHSLKYINDFIVNQKNLFNLVCKDMNDLFFRKFIQEVVTIATIPFIHINNHDSLYLLKNYYVKVSDEGFNTLIINK